MYSPKLVSFWPNLLRNFVFTLLLNTYMIYLCVRVFAFVLHLWPFSYWDLAITSGTPGKMCFGLMMHTFAQICCSSEHNYCKNFFFQNAPQKKKPMWSKLLTHHSFDYTCTNYLQSNLFKVGYFLSS